MRFAFYTTEKSVRNCKQVLCYSILSISLLLLFGRAYASDIQLAGKTDSSIESVTTKYTGTEWTTAWTSTRTAKAAIGGTGRSAKAAIGGTGRTAKAAIGGTGRSAKAAIGGTGRTAKAAIGGTGRSAKAAIGGTGRTAKAAIGGTGRSAKAAIGGTGRTAKAAIGGTGRTLKSSSEISTPNSQSPDLTLVQGRIDAWYPAEREVQVLGQRLWVGGTDQYDPGAVIVLSGSVDDEGALVTTRVWTDNESMYVDGASVVVITGKVSSVDVATGKLNIGNLVVDYTPALSSGFEGATVGSIVTATGIRPISNGDLIAMKATIRN